MERLKVVHALQTCDGMPSQWEARLDDGRMLFVHYRYGYLKVRVGGNTLSEAVGGRQILTRECGGMLDGVISYLAMRLATLALIDWPAEPPPMMFGWTLCPEWAQQYHAKLYRPDQPNEVPPAARCTAFQYRAGSERPCTKVCWHDGPHEFEPTPNEDPL